MYSTRKLPQEFDVADQASKTLVAALVSAIAPTTAKISVPATGSWYSNAARKGNLYFLREGMLEYRREGRLLFSFNEGDLVGVENVFCSSDSNLVSEFAVIVDEYSADEFFDAVNKSESLTRTWNEYLAQQFKLFSIMLASLVNEQEGFVPDVRFYSEGEYIIEQGSIEEEIYTMVEGAAEVLIDGKKVGEVNADEMFGALAGLTGTPRMASVLASTDCMVVVLSRGEFKHLLLTRPQTVIKLIEEMAGVIQDVAPKERLIAELKG